MTSCRGRGPSQIPETDRPNWETRYSNTDWAAGVEPREQKTWTVIKYPITYMGAHKCVQILLYSFVM